MTLDYAVETFASHGNINAIDAVIGELPASKLSGLLDSITPELTSAGIMLGTQSSNTYIGDQNDNIYFGLGGNDDLRSHQGNDQLFGDAGNDLLYGGKGDDILHGGSGNDTIYGDPGQDIIYGGKGADNLYGGTEADTFAFSIYDVRTGVDTIHDFNLAEGDKIDISDVLEQYNEGDALSDFARLVTSGTNTLLQVDVDGAENGHTYTTLVTINNVTDLDLNTLVTNGDVIV